MRAAFRHIFLFLTQKEKNRFSRLVFLDILISILDIAFLVLLLVLIDLYSRPEKYRAFAGRFFEEYPLLPALVFFLLFTLKNVLAFAVSKMQLNFIYATASRISASQLSNFLSGKYADFIQTDSAVYFRSIGQQPLEFCNYVLKGVQQIISQSVLVVLTAIPVIVYNPTLFPLLLLILLPPLALSGFIMKKKLNGIRLSIKSTGERSGQYLKEALASFAESNIYDTKHFFSQRYNHFRTEENKYQADHQHIQNLPSRLIEVFAVFGLFCLIAINAYSSTAGGLSIITTGAFMAAAYKLIPGIVKILNSIGQIKTYWFTVNGLAKKTDDDMNTGWLKKDLSTIECRNIHFSYGNEKVLNGLSFAVHAGELIGIAGVSGKGKSTLVNLLLGFLSPDSGEIILNGSSVTAKDCRSYCAGISYVKQEGFLFHDSMLKNITMEENGYDEERFGEAIRISGADELIAKNKDGLHALVSGEGKNFSGGQRQRIILARALYKDYSTLILDEPFNEMDEAAEKNLTLQLKKIATRENKLIILITHSRENLLLCDRKIILE